MIINRQNYEAYFLDYIEGKLNAAQVAELKIFLADNPDLKTELESYEPVTLLPDTNVFIEKDSLKKDILNISNINESNFEEFCIARLEGDLDKNTETIFDSFLRQHPDKFKEYKLYLQTRLNPDKKIIFNEKRKLKHFRIALQKKSIFTATAVAASLALIFLAYNIVTTKNITNNNVTITSPKENSAMHILRNNLKSLKENKIEKQSKNLDFKKEEKNEFINIVNKEEFKTKKEAASLEPLKSIEPNELKVLFFQASPIIAQIQLQEKNKTASEPKDKYLSLNEYAEQEIKSVIKNQQVIDEKGLNLWALVKSGAKELDRLIGTNVNLKKTTDTTTNRTRIEINTGLLGYYSSSQNK